MARQPPYAIIIPARDEAEALPLVLDEMAEAAHKLDAVFAVGANACTDNTATVAEQYGALVGVSQTPGYGHACTAAINALQAAGVHPEAYLFVAADGANTPEDVLRLVDAHRSTGFPMVIGERTLTAANWRSAGASRALPNVTLGLWTTLLTGRPWLDLGPLRLIEAELFHRMNLREMTWGWTIEAQILAARLQVPVARIGVDERPRIAGQQKVSGVSLRRSLRIGLAIVAAGWRTRRRPLDLV